MVQKEISLDAALSACRYVQFSLTDLVRQLQGQAFGALGLDPVETPYRIISSGSFWRVRDYSALNTGQPLLVVAEDLEGLADERGERRRVVIRGEENAERGEFHAAPVFSPMRMSD